MRRGNINRKYSNNSKIIYYYYITPIDLLLPKDYRPLLLIIVYLNILITFTTLQAYIRAYRYALFKRDSQLPKVPTRIIYTYNKEGKGDSKAKDPNIYK